MSVYSSPSPASPHRPIPEVPMAHAATSLNIKYYKSAMTAVKFKFSQRNNCIYYTLSSTQITSHPII